ncbi:MAG: ribosome-binding factor A [Candidatus Saccharimonadales bacterium]
MLHRDRRLAAAIEKSFAIELNKLLPGVYVGVAEVEVSSDSKFATIWLSIMSDNKESILTEVIENKPRLMQALTESINIRKLPSIEIKLDNRLDYAQRISNKIKDINRE